MTSLNLSLTTNYSDDCQSNWHDRAIGGYFIGYFRLDRIETNDHRSLLETKLNILFNFSNCHYSPINPIISPKFNNLKLNFLRGRSRFKLKLYQFLSKFKLIVLT